MKFYFSILFLPILLALQSFPASSQTPAGEYMKVDYLFVDPAEQEQFLGFATTTWKSFQQERIDEGKISGWQLYRVRFSGNKSDNYNYVSVTSTKSMEVFEIDDFRQIGDASGRSSGTPVADLLSEQPFVQSEIWRVRRSVLRDREGPQSRFLMMDFMNVSPGSGYQYVMFEDEIARPLHEDRMEQDRMNAWEVYQLITPGGLNYGYNYATGNFFNKLEHVEFGFTDELIRANHPDVNVMEFFETIYAMRDRVQSDIWKLLEYVE